MNALKLKQLILGLAEKNSQDGRLSFWLSYVHNRHRIPNFKSPKDLSELWIKRVLDGKVNELYYLADKYAVRDYVKKKGLEYILTPELGVYDKGADIDFDSLPDRFALKANFGAGRNIICTNKAELDYEATRRQIDEWLKPSVYSLSERHYNLIPKKIVCEEFIDDGTGGFPVDYKFMCINGKVHCILGVSGREQGHGSYLPYSPDWMPIYNYYRGNATASVLLSRPANLDEMINVAERLAEGIDLVRVDLYSNGSRIWFGEITLTPSGCIFHRWTQKALDDMGAQFLRQARTTKVNNL